MDLKTLNYIQAIAIIILTILLFRSCNDKKNTDSNFEESPNNLSLKSANDMEELYKNYQYALISKSLGVRDNREYWFPLKELKSYVSYIEKKADSLNYDKDNLGIRVYNGAKKKDNKIKSSIFMIGTYSDYKNERSEASFNFINLTKEDVLYRVNNKNMIIDAFNYGSSGEPPIEFSAR